jgi:transcriptional regulator with XRE-family HTH domain
MHWGTQIRDLRLRRGLTQQEMASLLQCGQSAVSRLERSQVCAIRTLERIAKVLGVDLKIEFVENKLP